MGGNGRYVLVVEDDDVVRHLLTALLEDEGYRVEAVTNGAAALQLLAEATAPEPEVILLDMWMPVPASSTTSVPSPGSTETHAVLPP